MRLEPVLVIVLEHLMYHSSVKANYKAYYLQRVYVKCSLSTTKVVG